MYTYHLRMVIAPLLRTHKNGTWVSYGLPPRKARISEFNQMKSLGSPAQLELHPDHEALFTESLGGYPGVCLLITLTIRMIGSMHI